MDPEFGEHFNLKWNSHHAETFRAFETHRASETLVDVVLFCNGHYIKAHKLILSACSVYFEKLFQVTGSNRQPVLIFRDTGIDMLRLAIDFMYSGEVEVPSEKLPQFIQLAESLEIKGLRIKEESAVSSREESPAISVEEPDPDVEEPEPVAKPPDPPAAKKRRINQHQVQHASPQKTKALSNSRAEPAVAVARMSPPSPSGFVSSLRASPPVVEDPKQVKSVKSRGNHSSAGSEAVKADAAPLNSEAYVDGSDEMEFGEDEMKGEAAAFDLEGLDLDRPQHVPPDITVEGPSPELHGLFRGRDQRGRLVYLCGFCQYTASKKTHGIDHVRIHLGDRPFACSICGRKFTRKQHMRKHEFLHRVKQESESFEVVELGCNSPGDSPDDDHDQDDHSSEHNSSNGPDSSGYIHSADGDDYHQSGFNSVTID